MEIIIYHCNTSYASQKLRLYLAEKNIPWSGVHIDLRKQENISSDYRKINPQGTVPAMQNGNKIICGSTKIMLYLEECYPEPRLLSENEDQRQQEIDFCYSHEALHDPHIRLLSYINIFMNAENRKKLDIEHILQLAENHPWPKRGEFLKRVLNNEISDQEIADAKAQINTALAHMQDLLQNSDGNFLFDNKYSIADSVATASLFRIEKIGMQDAIKAQSLVVKYYNTMRERGSFVSANML